MIIDLLNNQNGGSANSVRATYDTSPTTNSYSEGDYIYYNDTLYVVTTSIAAGTALVVDTNIKDPDLPSDTIVSIDGLPGSGGSGTVSADDVTYDNTTSGLSSTNVQTAIDEIDAEVDDIVNVYGSKNLFPVKMTSQTRDGVTFTQNSDGSITVTGTPNNPIGFSIADNTWQNYDIGWLKDLNGKTLEISGVANDAESGIQFIIAIYNGDQPLCIWNTANDASRIAVCNTTGATHYAAWLYVYDTTKNYNVTVYPMLRLASIPDSTYEPYSMTNQQITKRLSGQSNRNLMDNPWFTVNQRGQSSYTGSGYTVDRWILLDANATVTPVSGGVTITSASNSYWTIGQKFETKYTGNVFTVSVNVDGVIHSFTFTSGFDGSSQNDGTIWVWLTTEGSVYIGQAYSTTITIRAVKLELGSKSTLAYDVAPNYAEELLKCQRYFVKTAPRYVGAYGNTEDTSMLNIVIPVPVPMAGNPVVTGNFLAVFPNSGVYTIGSGTLTFVKCNNNILYAGIPCANTRTAYDMFIGYSSDGLSISCDL